LQNFWTPVFTGVTTFYEFIRFIAWEIFRLLPYQARKHARIWCLFSVFGILQTQDLESKPKYRRDSNLYLISKVSHSASIAASIPPSIVSLFPYTAPFLPVIPEGGASLEFLEGKPLPGVVALNDR
jgi:hypothetical protein